MGASSLVPSSARTRAEQGKEKRSAEEEKEAEKVKLFKKRRLDERVLADNATVDELLAKGEKISLKLKESYVRARTDKPVPEKGDTLSARFDELKSKPVVVRLGEEPDDYPTWLAQQAKAQPVPPVLEAAPAALEEAKPTAWAGELAEAPQPAP